MDFGNKNYSLVLEPHKLVLPFLGQIPQGGSLCICLLVEGGEERRPPGLVPSVVTSVTAWRTLSVRPVPS